jgi:hypothetical protein
MYIGDTTEDPPTANPPKNLKNTNDHQFQANAHPTAEIKYNTAINIKVSRLPKMSAGLPTAIDPIIVPISALATVNPNKKSVNSYSFFNHSVVPEITAVSNPNNKPPIAATITAPYNLNFIF